MAAVSFLEHAHSTTTAEILQMAALDNGLRLLYQGLPFMA